MMRRIIGVLMVLCLVSGMQAGAEPLVEGRVRLASGEPAVGASVRLFDLADLRKWVGATTDEAGYFALPLRALPGAAALPERFALGPNYPNPFNPSTLIPYQLPVATHVRLEVFNVLGQRVATVVDGEQSAGFHTARWDATDAAGRAAAAGVYLYRLQAGGESITRRMVLIDGQAGLPRASSGGWAPAEAGPPETGIPVYGLTVSGEGLVPYVDPGFGLEAGRGPVDLVVEARADGPPAKVATEGTGGILGDVNNDGQVTMADALVVVIHHLDATLAAPNNGDISLGDVNADGRIDLTDALLIMTYSVNPNDPTLPEGIGGPVAEESPAPDGDLRYPEATPVAANSQTAGMLAGGETDYYRVTLSGPGTLVAYTTGGTDTYGYLEDNAGTVRDQNDDAVRGNRNFRVSAVVTAGTYYVRVRGFVASITGAYTLHVEFEPGETVASLSPDPSTATFTDDGAWHRFTVQAGEAVSVVANPEGTTPRLKITTRSVGSNFCPAEAEDDVSRRDGQAVYLAGCATGTATVELQRRSDGTVLNTYTFEVTGSPADLIVESVSVSDNTLTPGQSFTLSATVRNQGTGRSAATTLRWYLSSDTRITTQDTEVGTDPVTALGGSRTSAKSIRLTAPSSEGTWYYGACVVSVTGESVGNNCSLGVRVIVKEYDREEILVFTDPQIYNDNVFVLPVTENLAAGSLPLKDYAARFYENFDDAFDFLIIVTNLPEAERPVSYIGRYLHVKNDVQGIGLSIFSDNSNWGSAGKLQGVIDFPIYSTYYKLGRSVLFEGPTLHELMHRWANFIVPPYEAAIGAHWGFTSVNGILGGFDIANLVDHGGGQYTAGDIGVNFNTVGWGNTRPYSPIELYLAGLIPPEEVPDFLVAEEGQWLRGADGLIIEAGNGEPIFTASRLKTYTIEDIIAEHGRRDPDHSQAQKDFRAAVILLIDKDHLPTRGILETLSDDISWFSHVGNVGIRWNDRYQAYNFYEATGGRGTITMDELSHFQRRGGSAKRLAPSSFGTPPPPIVDHWD